MILSRFPIVKSSHHAYSYSYQSDGAVERGVIYAKIQLGQKSFLNIFTSHMNSSRLKPDTDLGPELLRQGLENRKFQIQEMTEFVSEILEQEYDPDTDLNLLIGDFNVLRFPIWDKFYDKRIKANANWKANLDELNIEYDSVLVKTFLAD